MKFKYNDKVTVTEGFYSTQTALVKVYHFTYDGHDMYEIDLGDGLRITVYETEIESSDD